MTTIDYVIQITGYLLETIHTARNTRNIQNEMNFLLPGNILAMSIPFELPSNIIIFYLSIRSHDMMDITLAFTLFDRTNNTKLTIDIVNDRIIYRYIYDNITENNFEITLEDYEQTKSNELLFSLSVFNFNKQIIKDTMNYCPKIMNILSTLKHII